jgi:hypothetical protein
MSSLQHLKTLQDYVAALKTVKAKYEAAEALEITDANIETSYADAKSMSEKLFLFS